MDNTGNAVNMWVFLGILGAAAVFAVMLFNRFIALRQARKNAFADVDVQLKQRFNLVPQLVETVKGYATHEKGVFETVTQARAQVGKTAGSGAGGERLKAESALGMALTGLFAVAENYPALKADQNFRQLMSELSDIENKIAAARRFFNSATNEYNTAIQQFPGFLIASACGFRIEPFFELEGGENDPARQAPDVKFT